MREFVEKFLEQYNTAKNENFSQHPLGNFIRKKVPEQLYETHIVNPTTHLITGSVGQGNWATIPWVCVFDRMITTSAQYGVYIVYLLSADGQTLYLTLNQGCTKIRNDHSKSETLKILKDKSELISSGVDGKGFIHDNNIRLSLVPNDLAEFYQAGTIFYKAYRHDAIPSEEELQADLSQMMMIYSDYVTHFEKYDSEKQNQSILLTWNPSLWLWNDFDEAVKNTLNTKTYEEQWSCARKDIIIGQRVFLMMIGNPDTNGIVASGNTISSSFEAEHWDEEKKKQGMKIDYVRVRFDKIVDYRKDPYLMQSELKILFPAQKWSPQNSGIAIRPEYINDLELKWGSIKQEKRNIVTDKETINHISKYIAAKGFKYDEGLIQNFFLCLKSKPFVLLAGTSGTGKTRLTKLFAEAVGATNENGRYKMVPVRPDWSDSSDLFGHVDLSGKFVPGAIIDFISEAQKNPKLPYFLCFDEMNLARVEYYLSDFLSIIETRELRDGVIQSDPLVNTAFYGKDEEAKAKYEKVYFPENLYVIGTVNMDETTFPFSKKVLDRANTIEFSYVDIRLFDYAQNDSIKALSMKNSFFKSSYLNISNCMSMPEAKIYSNMLHDINEILTPSNSNFGYRVRDEIVYYLIYNKTMLLLDENNAIDYSIMQKILPRIHGSSYLIKELLCNMFAYCSQVNFIGQLDAGDIGDRMIKTIQQKEPKYKLSANKIAFMMRRLEEDGFTSYWL